MPWVKSKAVLEARPCPCLELPIWSHRRLGKTKCVHWGHNVSATQAVSDHPTPLLPLPHGTGSSLRTRLTLSCWGKPHVVADKGFLSGGSPEDMLQTSDHGLMCVCGVR